MARSIKVSSRTTAVLLVINLVVLSSIFIVAFNNPFASGTSSKVEEETYGLQTKLAWSEASGEEGVIVPVSEADSEPHASGHPCIIALEKNARLSLNMYGASSLVAPQCSVHSHSTSPFGVNLENVEQVDVAAVFSGGSVGRGYEAHGFQLVSNAGESGNPFAHVETPATDDCDHRDLVLKTGDHVLQPGVYCGGIVSLTSKQIALAPGVYIVKNGPLAIGGKASLLGEGVSFVFDGPNAVFSFGVATKLALKAPSEGPLAGILFFENPNSPKNREFVVRSHDAGLMEGTIYLPKGKFVIDSYGRVGHASNWSAIVANQIEIINGASLQINTNHAASDVPLPNYLKERRALSVASID